MKPDPNASSKPEFGPDGLTKQDRVIIREAVACYPDIQRLTLFGSRAMGTFGRGSDIDLAIQGPNLTRKTLAKLAADLEESSLPYKVDLLLQNDKLDDAIKQHLRQHGKPFDWEEITFGEVTINHDAKRIPVRGRDRIKGSYPYYGASGIVDYVDDYIYDGLHLLVAEDGENLKTRQTPIAFLAKGQFWVNNHAHVVTGNELADTEFLCYTLAAKDISGFITGSTIPKLSQKSMNAIPLRLPPLDEQRAIASVLGSLDDKIEQNRRTAATLEALARAVFRAWFVNFEPVHAKAAGAASFPSMPQPIFDQLPNTFTDSELGPIPQGWEVKTIGDLISLPYGKALKADNRVAGTVPVYGSNGQVGWHDTTLVTRAGIVIGRKGNPGTVKRVGQPFYPIDTTFYVERGPDAPRDEFLFYLLEHLDLPRLSADSAVPGLNRNAAYAEPCICPVSSICESFAEIASVIWQMIEQANNESRKLAELRDYLLPKLLCGAVRVSEGDAGQLVEGIA